MNEKQEKHLLQIRDNLLAENNRYLNHIISKTFSEIPELRKAIQEQVEDNEKELQRQKNHNAEERLKEKNQDLRLLYNTDSLEKRIKILKIIVEEQNNYVFLTSCKMMNVNPYKSTGFIIIDNKQKEEKLIKLYNRVGKMSALHGLKDFLPKSHTNGDQVLEDIRRYGDYFNNAYTQDVFKKDKDVQHIKKIKNILFSFCSVFIYTAVRALYSKYDRNSFAFYKPRKELLQDKLIAAEKAVDNIKPKLSK